MNKVTGKYLYKFNNKNTSKLAKTKIEVNEENNILFEYVNDMRDSVISYMYNDIEYYMELDIKTKVFAFKSDSFKRIGIIDFEKTDIYGDDIDALNYGLLFIIKALYIINNDKKGIRKRKELFCDKCINDKFKIEFKCYKIEEENQFKIEDTKIKGVIGMFEKYQFEIPSKMFPLPSNKNIRIFTENNTEELSIDIVEKLDCEKFYPGRCYSNTKKIVEFFNENSYDAKFYSGWIIKDSFIIHHAWCVIDNNVIDVGLLKKELILKEKYKTEKNKDKEEIIKELFQISNEPITFKDKYCFGKVFPSHIYIGVETDLDTAIKSFNKLLEDYPDHRFYRNINKKTGSNYTLDKFYSLY